MTGRSYELQWLRIHLRRRETPDHRGCPRHAYPQAGLDVYDTQREWFEDIDADNAEMQVLNVCVAPTVLLASWSLGETYEYSTEDLQPERRAAFWDYSWEFPMHRRCLPEHLEAEFTATLTSVANDNCPLATEEALSH
ncbi:hypothetical protein B0H14DRAFT_3426550 [Mycena olivaceomarginata]|nr:hypothetical protein B0H14DRAFT_3426550 [Mycena olivaceomarginata]